jgi:hypothetical protein
MHLDASVTFVAIRLLKCFGLYDVASKNISIFTCVSIEPAERRNEVVDVCTRDLWQEGVTWGWDGPGLARNLQASGPLQRLGTLSLHKSPILSGFHRQDAVGKDI